MNIKFTKMHGCGNDFIIMDNREDELQIIEMSNFIKKVCTRKFHIGANGLVLLEKSSITDFSMRYFNADGSEGEMCGNGARCIAKFAYENKIVKKEMKFETLSGIYEAIVREDGDVEINFPNISLSDVQLNLNLEMEGMFESYHFAIVGVPHTVIFTKNIEMKSKKRFETWARQIRYREDLFPQGTNVNIVHVRNEHEISIRTYERGVEEETYACGSGATASAIIASLLKRISSPVCVQTKGGRLFVQHQLVDDRIEEISLTGNAVVVYTGEIAY